MAHRKKRRGVRRTSRDPGWRGIHFSQGFGAASEQPGEGQGLREPTTQNNLLVFVCMAMEVNGDRSVENLHASAAVTPSPSTGASEVAPNHGGGGLEVLGQAVESTTIAPSKSVPAETAPVVEQTTGVGSPSLGDTGEIACDLIRPPPFDILLSSAREPLLSGLCGTSRASVEGLSVFCLSGCH